MQVTYDGLGRVLTKISRFGTGQAATTTYSYDQARTGYFNVGQQTTLANAAGTIEQNFDEAGRLERKDFIVSGTTYSFATGYDVSGRVLWQSYPDGDMVGSPTTPITYDGPGRQKTIPGLVSNILYDAAGQVTSFVRSNGATTTYSYSTTRKWLTTLNTVVGGATLQNLVYGRDAAGRITGVASNIAGESWTYGYDDLDRLLSATNTNTPALTQTFTYNSVGNMTSNSGVGAYSYPAPGSARPHAVTSTPLGSYGYDANGNMTSAPGDTLAYDGDNRLSSVNTVSFVYGPDGERLKKLGASTTLFFGGDAELGGGVLTKYLPGDAKRVATTSYWLHRDHLQSVRVTTNNAGAVVQRAQFKPYGEELQSIALIPESKAFIGERQDDETGLLYLHARYYDPTLGRFLQPDTLDPDIAGVDVNRYAYALDNPIMLSDPNGHFYADTTRQGDVERNGPTDRNAADVEARDAQIGAMDAEANPEEYSRLTLQREIRARGIRQGTAAAIGTLGQVDPATVASVVTQELEKYRETQPSAVSEALASAPAQAMAGLAAILGAINVNSVRTQITNEQVQRAWDRYAKGVGHPNQVGDGTLAAAVESERTTGQPTQGKWHSQAAAQHLNRLNNIERDLTKQGMSLSNYDKALMDTMRSNLQRALSSGTPKGMP